MSSTGFLLKNLPFAIEHDIAWRLNVRLHRRPTSAPFLSGDTFRYEADWVFEDDQALEEPRELPGGLVFSASSLARRLLDSGKGLEGSVVVFHNGDENIGEGFQRQLDRTRCRHVFAQNCLVNDPRITPLPIGLENQWYHQNGHVKDFVRLRDKAIEMVPRIAWGFNLATNPDERWPCCRALWKNPVGVPVPVGINARLYRRFVRPYMFMASPPGNGADCHRTWEALYLRIVPIVKRSAMTEFFLGLGLPMLLVDDWRELSRMTESFLADTYERLRPGFDLEALWLPYWRAQFTRYLDNAA